MPNFIEMGKADSGKIAVAWETIRVEFLVTIK